MREKTANRNRKSIYYKRRAATSRGSRRRMSMIAGRRRRLQSPLPAAADKLRRISPRLTEVSRFFRTLAAGFSQLFLRQQELSYCCDGRAMLHHQSNVRYRVRVTSVTHSFSPISA